MEVNQGSMLQTFSSNEECISTEPISKVKKGELKNQNDQTSKKTKDDKIYSNSIQETISMVQEDFVYIKQECFDTKFESSELSVDNILKEEIDNSIKTEVLTSEYDLPIFKLENDKNISKCKRMYIHPVLQKNDSKSRIEKPLMCGVCYKRFTESSNLNEHLKYHFKNNLKCVLCPKQFCHRSSLTAHMKTHMGEKPHKCQICSKDFTKKSKLQRHSLVHGGIKPFKCEICLKTFIQRTDLKKHLNVHTKSV